MMMTHNATLNPTAPIKKPGAVKPLWVCPWGICSVEQAQHCRAEMNPRKGCGGKFTNMTARCTFDYKELLCPYCGNKTQLVGGLTIYPHRPDLYKKQFYQCAPCDAYVGCHPGTTKPLGRLADAELRKAKMAAHAAFDPLWRNGARAKRRKAAYAWLAEQLGIDAKQCHIGMLDVATCSRVVEVCKGHNQQHTDALFGMAANTI